MIEASELHAAHRDHVFFCTGIKAPGWEQLSWVDKDKWQERADEVNAADSPYNYDREGDFA